MSKVRGPLHSIGAHGTIGKAMIHQSWKGVPRVKKYRKPTQPNSAAQLEKRNLISTGVERWQGLADFLKNYWKIAIENVGKTMSGYNFFLSQYLNDIIAGKTPSDYPPQSAMSGWPILPGLVSWWKLNKGEGNIAHDSIGPNNGTIHGALWTPGKKHFALSFDGIDNYVNCGTDVSLNIPNSITLEAWIKPNILNGTYGIIGRHTSDLDATGTIRTYGPNIYVIINIGGTFSVFYTTNSPLSVNQWHHVVYTYNGSVEKIYINFIEKATRGNSGVIYTPAPHTYIGATYSPTVQNFNGIIDEVRIYNRALSLDEIQHNFKL